MDYICSVTKVRMNAYIAHALVKEKHNYNDSSQLKK